MFQETQTPSVSISETDQRVPGNLAQANDYVESYYEVFAELVGDKVPTQEGKALRIKELEGFLKENSAAGGVICLVCVALNLLCGHCSSILMGYKYTTRRTMLVSNFMTWVLGLTTSIVPH